MKHILNRVLLVVGLVAIVLVALYVHKSKLSKTTIPTTSIQAEKKSVLAGVSKPKADFNKAEKAELAQRFSERLKPAIDRWCNAYAGRLPFNASDVTLDKFHSTLAGGMFTFMLGDTTLTIADNKNGTKVFYFMTRQAARQLNSIPQDGQPRNLSVPITAAEVIQMVKADTGIDYEPKQIEIKPTATACALDGGAFVDVDRKMIGGNEIITLNSLSFVVGSDGKLVAYQH